MIKLSNSTKVEGSLDASASYALTASYALNGGSGGSGSINTSSFVVTASGANNNLTASYALTALFALNGGNGSGSTGDYVVTASGALTNQTASYALTSSFALGYVKTSQHFIYVDGLLETGIFPLGGSLFLPLKIESFKVRSSSGSGNIQLYKNNSPFGTLRVFGNVESTFNEELNYTINDVIKYELSSLTGSPVGLELTLKITE